MQNTLTSATIFLIICSVELQGYFIGAQAKTMWICVFVIPILLSSSLIF